MSKREELLFELLCELDAKRSVPNRLAVTFLGIKAIEVLRRRAATELGAGERQGRGVAVGQARELEREMKKRRVVLFIVGGTLVVEAIAHGPDGSPHIELQVPGGSVAVGPATVVSSTATASDVTAFVKGL